MTKLSKTKEISTKKVESEKKSPIVEKKAEITEEKIIKAIKKAGGEANITPLYNAFDKTGFEKMEPSKLKTKLRDFTKKMALKGKVQCVHKGDTRAWTFVLPKNGKSK